MEIEKPVPALSSLKGQSSPTCSLESQLPNDMPEVRSPYNHADKTFLLTFLPSGSLGVDACNSLCIFLLLLMFQGPWTGAESNPLSWSISCPGVSSCSQHDHACHDFLQGVGSVLCDPIHFDCNLKMLQGLLVCTGIDTHPSPLGCHQLQLFCLVEDELSGVNLQTSSR